MNRPMMPKATAVWLVENTALTFRQIAEFCELHELEVQAIADEDIVIGMAGIDPIQAGQLTEEEIDRCQADPEARLVLKETDIPMPVQRSKGARYTPIAKRQDKPDGIAWLLKHHPELTDPQISKLLGTTKNTINAVRDRSHWNSSNIRARDPMDLGLCSYADYNAAVEIGRARLQKEGGKTKPAPKPAIDFGISSLVGNLPGSGEA
ncbi:MAG: DUF1013 domain-containing protein [Rhodospirillaceae bacterium]|nr:DUF1013 domain-containing protein [Rhodospirillaceae bacterium]